MPGNLPPPQTLKEFPGKKWAWSPTYHPCCRAPAQAVHLWTISGDICERGIDNGALQPELDRSWSGAFWWVYMEEEGGEKSKDLEEIRCCLPHWPAAVTWACISCLSRGFFICYMEWFNIFIRLFWIYNVLNLNTHSLFLVGGSYI